MTDIYISTWTFRKKSKLTPGKNRALLGPPLKVHNVVVAGNNKEALLNNPRCLRIVLRSIGIKTQFDNYSVIDIEFIKTIGSGTNEA